jgi:hypothetical protein
MEAILPILITIITIIIVVVAALFSIVLTIAPFALIGWFIYKRAQQAKEANLASQNWLMTNGKVIKSRVEVSGGNYTSVTPRVIYEYEVGGQTYRGERIRAGDKFLHIQTSGSRTAYDTVDRYAEGTTVTVFYNPQNPAEAVLER